MTGDAFGPYRLMALIGRGGMGEVWKAVDTGQGDRQVALKLLGAWLNGDPQFARRFQRESAMAARLTSPNIVPIHRYGEIDGRLYLDMPLIEGTDLGTLLAGNPLPPQRAVEIITQVARALDAAHRAGLVHRDVKPSNILVTPEDHVYLIDFGIARGSDVTQTSQTGALMGSVAYMAPERFSGEGDHRTDIYALGCVLHETLTGQPAFGGTDPLVLLNAHTNGPRPRPTAVRPALPSAWDGVVGRALARDPAQRFETAGDLAAAARAAVTAPFATEVISKAGVGPTAEVSSPQAVSSPGIPAHAGPSHPGSSPAAASYPPSYPPSYSSSYSSSYSPANQPPYPPQLGQPPNWYLAGQPPPSQPVAAAAPRRSGRTMVLALLAALVVVGAALTGVVLISRSATGGGSGATPPSSVAAATTTPPQPLAEGAMTGHTDSVYGVATAQLDGHTVVVSASRDDSLRVWDPVTRQPIGRPLQGHTDSVAGVTTAQLDGRAVAVSGGFDRTVRVWDLATHQQIGQSLTGHTDTVFAVTTAVLDGRPVIISGSADKTMRVWDLATHQQIGDPLTGHTDTVYALTTTVLDGRPVIVSGSYDDSIRVWDLASHQQLGPPITAPDTGDVESVAITQLDGRPVIVSGNDDDAVHLWDLAGHQQIGAPLRGHTSDVENVTTTVLNGQPVAVTGSADHTVRVWDLSTGRQLGAPLTEETDTVYAVTTATVNGRQAIIAGDKDHTLRLWDAATHGFA